MAFLIFLDFDGVTHPMGRAYGSPYNTRCLRREGIRIGECYFLEEHVNQVKRLISALNAQVVISSAWRLDFGWQAFNGLFSGRVIGQTPWIDMRGSGYENLRYREILRYLAENRFAHIRWLAVDDNRTLFPTYAPVYITESARGLTATDVDRLLARYRVGQTSVPEKPYV